MGWGWGGGSVTHWKEFLDLVELGEENEVQFILS